MKSKEELKKLFENGDIPKQEDFWEWQDSYLHKEEKISQDSIEGLSLDSKLDKPVSTGNFFVRNDGNSTSYEAISPSSDYLPYWDGNNFKSSLLYQNTVTNKMGLGTSEPSEQLHLSGKAKMSALVLDENPEESPYQITYNNRKFYGADSTGTKKQFMYATISDMTSSMFSATDIEKDAWRLAQRKTDESYSLGQPRIDAFLPFTFDTNLGVQTLTIIGLNLFLNNSSPTLAKVVLVRVKDNQGTPISPDQSGLYPTEITVDNIEVQQSNPKLLNCRVDFSTLLKGYYSVKVLHNNIWSILNPNNTIIVSDSIVSSPLNIGGYDRLTVNANESIIDDLKSSTVSISNDQNTNTYLQSKNAVVTLAEQLEGVCLTFKIKLGSMYSSYGGWSGDTFLTLCAERPLDELEVSEVKVYKSDNTIMVYPNGNSLYTGYRGEIDDTLHIMFKDNFLKIVLVNSGYTSTTPYIPSAELYLKLILKSWSEAYFQGGSGILLEPIKKYQI